MDKPINFPSHLGGEFFDMKPEDLPDEMLVRSTAGSHVKAGIYLDQIVMPRIESIADSQNPADIERLQVLREVERTLREIGGATLRAPH